MSTWQRWKGIMKCYPLEEKRLLKWKPPFIVQPKYDGFRCRAVPITTGLNKDEYILLSSEENMFYSVPHIIGVLTSLRLRAELDGELYCHGMNFDQISSILSRTVNIHPDHKQIRFHVFDIVNDQLQMRRQILVDALRGLNFYLEVAPFWLCESFDEILRIYDRVISMGYEGIIVRNAYAPYERKRSTMVMKFKPKKEDTYEILGFVEEVSKDGIPKGSLGSLICASGDGATFGVGSGFTEAQRQVLWQNKEDLVGKFAKIEYQHLTHANGKPRFSRFVKIVDDITY